MYTRRDLAKIALGALSAGRLLAKTNSTIRGIPVCVTSRSFRDLPLDPAIAGMVQAGIGGCDLWEGHVAPPRLNRKGLREWREGIAIEQFQLVAGSFNKAGVKIQAYNYDFDDDFSDREIERGFEFAKGLGTNLITCSAPPLLARRLSTLAVKAGVFVAVRNHEGLATSDELGLLLKNDPNIGVALDVSDFVAAGQDAVKFITAHLDRTYAVYLRDRAKEGADSVAFGRGSTPLTPVLKLIQGRRTSIPAVIDYDYQGKDAVTEVGRAFLYCRQILSVKF